MYEDVLQNVWKQKKSIVFCRKHKLVHIIAVHGKSQYVKVIGMRSALFENWYQTTTGEWRAYVSPVGGVCYDEVSRRAGQCRCSADVGGVNDRQCQHFRHLSHVTVDGLLSFIVGVSIDMSRVVHSCYVHRWRDYRVLISGTVFTADVLLSVVWSSQTQRSFTWRQLPMNGASAYSLCMFACVDVCVCFCCRNSE